MSLLWLSRQEYHVVHVPAGDSLRVYPWYSCDVIFHCISTRLPLGDEAETRVLICGVVHALVAAFELGVECYDALEEGGQC